MTKSSSVPISILGGVWFFFDIGDHRIAYWGSALSGREKLYVNDELVSNKFSLHFTSRHSFNLEGVEYVVELKVLNWLKYDLVCRLFKGEEEISVENRSLGENFNWMAFTVAMVVIGVIGYLLGFFSATIF